MKARLPVVTGLVVGAALVVALFPKLAGGFIYDRTAILSGEAWRLLTGHWVHLTTRHLIADVVVMGVAGWIIERWRLPGFGWLCGVAAGSGGVALLVFEPEMSRYAGLSGVALAALTYLGLCGGREKSQWRWGSIVLLAVLAGKIGLELSGPLAFSGIAGGDVRVASTSHLAGMVTAGVFFCGRECFRHRKIHEVKITGSASG